MIYSIDTSGLLDGWKRYYPPDVFPAVWENVAELIDNRLLLSTEEVFRELEDGNDDIYQWACTHKRMFLPLDADIQQSATEILTVHAGWIPPDRSRNMADPFVVAVARVKGCTVVSGEDWSTSPYPHKIKIPNVCHTFGVRHIKFLEMMRELGWVFRR